ncbi:MAG TPA: acetoin dehydrogenase [Gammaproteobacteria bacterium]|jgi:NAD(P)-dependent dehydrogenase (short-subunit alcohol dehydrogenase family)|nr:acetoin dehydrogenase [Gammaproteobacteria bacterium]
MSKFKDRICVVTGAGSGIGRALALQLHERGAKLALADIQADNLAETAELISKSGGNAFTKTLDVADQEAVFAFADEVKNELGGVHLVVNNAGVALGSGPLWDTEIDDFKWLMNINFYGVLYGTKAFLPILKEQDWGHIVNISSLFGLVGVPDQTAYNASKFAVRGLTEALRHELKREESTVSCTSVHPGGIDTNITVNARVVNSELSAEEIKAAHEDAVKNFKKLARTTPESAATQILKAVEKDKMRLLIGMDAKLLDLIQRFFPTRYANVMAYFVEKSTEAK